MSKPVKSVKSQPTANPPAANRLNKWRRPPKFGGRPETLRRVKLIRRNLDKTDAAIGRIYGVTRSAVHALRIRFGIPKIRGNTQARNRLIARVRALPPNLPMAMIAQELGLPKEKARHYASLAGYLFEPHVETIKRLRKAQIQALPPALTLSMVARQLGISYGHSLNLCQRYRYKVRRLRSAKPPRVPFRHPRKLKS